MWFKEIEYCDSLVFGCVYAFYFGGQHLMYIKLIVCEINYLNGGHNILRYCIHAIYLFIILFLVPVK